MQNPIYTVKCPNCGLIHNTSNPAKSYCSKRCSKAYQYKRLKLRKRGA